MQQYFIETAIDPETLILFTPEQSHHIMHVMRMKPDTIVRIADGNGKVCEAKISYCNGQPVAEFHRFVDDVPSRGNVILAQALIKKDKWEWVLQKAAELGADTVVPVKTKRTVVKMDDERTDKKTERWNKITREASEQSHRHTACKVAEPMSLQQVSEIAADIRLVAYEKEGQDAYLSRYIPATGSVLIGIGPEGGFEPSEVEFLVKRGFISCNLGSRILRAETASLYALSVMDCVREG